MINRELIRLKLVQITYSYYQNGSQNPVAAESELLLSLSRAYDLYNSMLLLMVELNRMALRILEMRQSRAKRLGEKDFISAKFVENRFMHQLESNKQLQKYRESQRFDWADQEEYVRSLYNKIEASEFYHAYMTSGKSSYDEDREMWRLIYRHLICNNEELDSVLEELDLYWNDE